MKFQVGGIFLFLWLASMHVAFAQEGSDGIKEALTTVLETYVVDLEPDNNCECNECKHTYKGGYKITKKQSVEGTLRLWGMAGVKYKSLYGAGEGKIYFYAEFKKVNGVVQATKLKWRKGDCMKFQTIFQDYSVN